MSEGQGETFQIEIDFLSELNDNDNPDPTDTNDSTNNNAPDSTDDIPQGEFGLEFHYRLNPSVRAIHRSCSVCFLSTFLVVLLWSDFIYCSYLRATLKEEVMQVAQHPNWNIESLFLIFQSTLSVAVATFITINVMAKIKLHDTIFHTSVLALALVTVTDAIWIISEQNDRRHWYGKGQDPSRVTEGTIAHESIRYLLEIKIVETFLLTITTLIWVREWNDGNHDLVLTRRVRRNVEPETRGTDNTNSGRTRHSVTIPQFAHTSEPTGRPGPSSRPHPPPMGSTNKNSADFMTVDESERNKIAKQEFREKGDGNEIDFATPKIIT